MSRVLMVIVFSMLMLTPAAAQIPADMSPDELLILEHINRSRLRENLVHLVPNPLLNEFARLHTEDLMQRPITELGDVFLTSDGANIDSRLDQLGYTPYSDGYIVDFVPLILRSFDPPQIIDYWFRNATDPSLHSRQMLRGQERLLPVFSPLYREVGIAARFNEENERYYYVLVFAAQPNVLPVIIADPNNLSVIAETVETTDVLLYIHDERVTRFGDGDAIGAIEYLRISEQPGEQPCPGEISLDWRAYENEIPWQLSELAGTKTLYVQMCGDFERTITMSTQVTYLDMMASMTTATPLSFPSPDVMSIAHATQTAAASATAYAPFAATVEAILTATAGPPAAATPAP